MYLEEHVSGFYSAISSYSSSLHDRANVDAAISPVITLTNNTDTQKVVLLCEGESIEWVRAQYITIYVLKISIKINASYRSISFTHIKCNGDYVEAHGGVCDTAEGWRLERQEDDTMSEVH